MVSKKSTNVKTVSNLFSNSNLGVTVPVDNQKETFFTYEEQGIKYKGFSKTLISPNNYILNNQQRIVISETVNGSSDVDIYTVPNGKRLFISSCVLSLISALPTNVYYITDGDSLSIPPQRIKIYLRVPTNQNLNLIFEPAIEITKTVRVGQILTSSDSSFYGWLE